MQRIPPRQHMAQCAGRHSSSGEHSSVCFRAARPMHDTITGKFKRIRENNESMRYRSCLAPAPGASFISSLQ